VNTANFLTIPATIVPEQEMLVCGDRRQTYQDTITRAQRLAAALASLGIGKGDRVALLAPNCAEYFELQFACGQLGAIMILHTWDQTLGAHFHVHCIVAAGALSAVLFVALDRIAG
jgi:acyl-CoA synthetase (AMP-forming)/AMP-acid ligase II